MERKTEDLINKTREYLDYFDNHIKNIWIAYKILKEKLLEKNKIKILNNDLKTFLNNENNWNLLYNQLKVHDFSKLSEEEFIPYRKNFFPINEEEKENNKDDFEKAKNHHYANNFHHPEGRTSIFYKNKRTKEEKIVDILENAIDWVAMSIFLKEKSYSEYFKIKEEELRSLLDNFDFEILKSIFLVLDEKEEKDGRF